MDVEETIVWGIHSGRSGEADNLFLRKNYVAIGWKEMGDMSNLESNREAFKKKCAEIYPHRKPTAIPNIAGQPFRFIHEMEINNIIIYSSKIDKQIHIGKVAGNYKYDPNQNKDFPHMRAIEWLGTYPRTSFTQGALYEIGAAMTFFQVKNFADEFITALTSRKTIPTPTDDNDTVEFIAAGIGESTRDFILKRISIGLKGHSLSNLVAHILEKMGYHTRVSPVGPDGGVDIIAHKDELGFEPPIIKVQVKSSEGNVGDPVVSALYGKVDGGEFGLFITLGSYTKQAINFSRNKSNLRLINGNEFVELILEYYEHMDSKYKGLIPLKRVYIPEGLKEIK